MAWTPCVKCGGPKRADGSVVEDAMYLRGGVCVECVLVSYLPKAYRMLEWIEPGGAYGELGDTGVPILDDPSGMRISAIMMGSRR